MSNIENILKLNHTFVLGENSSSLRYALEKSICGFGHRQLTEDCRESFIKDINMDQPNSSHLSYLVI